ncbi:MAG TPA: glycosyltransferase, partial [Candidatus Baltobacteraceae bacterium]
MPARNEASYLPAVLESLRAQTFDHARLSLIAVDGESEDGSAEIVRTWLLSADIDGAVITNPKRTIPSSLNLAIRHAQHDDYIVRLDSHTIYAPDYIATIMQAYDELAPVVGCVGGPQIPDDTRTFGHALVASLMLNPMGLGGAKFRTLQKPSRVEHVYLGAWRPGVLQAVGGFDERWRANEDSELSLRVESAGFQIYWVPLRARYRIKRNARGTVTQWSRYGYWRAQTLGHHPQAWRVRHVIPPLLLLGGLGLAISPLRLALVPLFALYAGGVLANRPRDESLQVSLAAPFFFCACQLAYAGGLITGLASYALA